MRAHTADFWNVITGFAVLILAAILPKEGLGFLPVMIGVEFILLSSCGVSFNVLFNRSLAILAWMILFGLTLPAASGTSRIEHLMLVLARTQLALFAGLRVITITPLLTMLDVLRRMGLPLLFVSLFGFTFRSLGLLWTELQRMQRAQLSRTLGKGSTMDIWRRQSRVYGGLIIRGLNRAERCHRAMLARGYQSDSSGKS